MCWCPHISYEMMVTASLCNNECGIQVTHLTPSSGASPVPHIPSQHFPIFSSHSNSTSLSFPSLTEPLAPPVARRQGPLKPAWSNRISVRPHKHSILVPWRLLNRTSHSITAFWSNSYQVPTVSLHRCLIPQVFEMQEGKRWCFKEFVCSSNSLGAGQGKGRVKSLHM